jgi:hypothetical protein
MEDGNLDPPPPKPLLYARGPRLNAMWPGHCVGCNLGIHEGQSIVRMSDDTWQHLVGCAGCGGLFMLDQALERKAPLGYPLP